MELEEVLERLEALEDPEAAEGMARYGITGVRVYGVALPDLKAIAKATGRDHDLAQRLWDSGSREARIIASLVDDPRLVTEGQMERWAAAFDSWEVTDQACSKLFDRTPHAYDKAVEWSARDEEFVKRAGFALMAALAVHDKKAADDRFLGFLPHILSGSGDDRRYVKKAVSWALRSIGKRNLALNARAVETAAEMRATGTKGGRWVASDALRELTSEKVLERLRERAGRRLSRLMP